MKLWPAVGATAIFVGIPVLVIFAPLVFLSIIAGVIGVFCWSMMYSMLSGE